MASNHVASLFHRLATELGVFSILHSSRDTKLLCLQRSTRLFAYGATLLILALYLSRLGSSDSRIGLFMTLTLLGDVTISFLLTLVADGLGRRNVLILGAFLMTVSGTIFAVSGNYWVLLAASISGVISPSGNEIGPFRAVEESPLAQLTMPEKRTDIFAWYTLLGNSGTACGTIFCGFIVQSLVSRQRWPEVGAYRMIFILYALLGLVKLGLSFMLSDACKPETTKHEYQAVAQRSPIEADDEEQTDELATPPTPTTSKPKHKSIWPALSPTSLPTLQKLSLLFAIDSFASGLVPALLQTYFFTLKFALPPSTLGTLFSTTNTTASLSALLASPLSKRITLIKTRLFTPLPSPPPFHFPRPP